MLLPKKVKYRKWQTGRRNLKYPLVETRGTELDFGSFGLKAISLERVRSNQIEAARKVLVRGAGKFGKIWIRIFPHQSVTAKPLAVRMGSGKGAVSHYVATVKPGTILYEIAGVPEVAAREALKLAGYKLPVKTKFMSRK